MVLFVIFGAQKQHETAFHWMKKNILVKVFPFRFQRRKSQTGLKWHDGEEKITELKILRESYLSCILSCHSPECLAFKSVKVCQVLCDSCFTLLCSIFCHQKGVQQQSCSLSSAVIHISGRWNQSVQPLAFPRTAHFSAAGLTLGIWWSSRPVCEWAWPTHSFPRARPDRM